MEGKRFGIGLAAGILLALAVVTVSGGLGSTPSALFAPSAASPSSTTTVANTAVATTTSTISMTTIPQTSTYTVSSTSTTSGGSESSLNSNVTYSASPASTTVTSTVSSVSSTANNSNQASLSVVTSTTSTTPYYVVTPSGTSKPSQLASIARQPVVSNAEILAPVLIAFLLGAFLYRVTARERERSSRDSSGTGV